MNIKLIAVAAIALTVFTVISAAPANAATSASITDQESLPAPALVPAPLRPATDVVQPDYAAGQDYFVCVETNGTLQTVLYEQSTVKICKGAAAIQEYLESGQFVKTVQLTTAGKAATGHFTPGTDCLLAVIGGGVGLIFTNKDESLVLTVPVAAGIAAHYCYSA